MAHNIEELIERLKKTPEHKREPTEKLFFAVNQQLDFALRILKSTHWWVGWMASVMGKPILTISDKVPTACVSLNPTTGKILYYFNLYFAASLTAGDIAYVIAHESLHVAWQHLKQIKTFNIKYPETWNVVTDAFINEFLDRSLRWDKNFLHEDRLDWITDHGIRWKDLPQAVQDKFPMSALLQDLETSPIEIYHAVLEDMEKKGIDPNQFEEAVKNKRFGKKVKRQKHNQPGQTGASEPVTFQKTYVEPGDVIYVKSLGTYGILKAVQRVKDQEGTVEVDTNDQVTRPEYIWLSRAIAAAGPKNFATSKKIVDGFVALKSKGKTPKSFAQLGAAIGLPQIAEIDQTDAAIDQYNLEHPEITPEDEEKAATDKAVGAVKKRATRRKNKSGALT